MAQHHTWLSTVGCSVLLPGGRPGELGTPCRLQSLAAGAVPASQALVYDAPSAKTDGFGSCKVCISTAAAPLYMAMTWPGRVKSHLHGADGQRVLRP